MGCSSFMQSLMNAALTDHDRFRQAIQTMFIRDFLLQELAARRLPHNRLNESPPSEEERRSTDMSFHFGTTYYSVGRKNPSSGDISSASA